MESEQLREIIPLAVAAVSSGIAFLVYYILVGKKDDSFVSESYSILQESRGDPPPEILLFEEKAV